MKLSITSLLNIRWAALLKSVWRWYNPFNKGLGICLRQSYLDLQIQDKTLSIVLTELMKKNAVERGTHIYTWQTAEHSAAPALSSYVRGQHWPSSTGYTRTFQWCNQSGPLSTTVRAKLCVCVCAHGRGPHHHAKYLGSWIHSAHGSKWDPNHSDNR